MSDLRIYASVYYPSLVDNGLSPGQRQAVIWTNTIISLIGPVENEILIKFHKFSFTKVNFKTSSRKWRPFCLGINVLNTLKMAPAPTPSVAHWEPKCVIPSNAFWHKWSALYSEFAVQSDPCAVRATFCQAHTEIMLHGNKLHLHYHDMALMLPFNENNGSI